MCLWSRLARRHRVHNVHLTRDPADLDYSEALTDNKTRTAGSIKSAVSKFDGSFSRVLYNFVRKGVIVISTDLPYDVVFEQTIDLGAEDLEQTDEGTFKVHSLA